VPPSPTRIEPPVRRPGDAAPERRPAATVSVPDPYKVLQVDPDAEEDVIRAAYKRLARKYHPDVSPDPASVARMVRINQAWEMLRDPVRRAAVDRARQRAAATSARVVAADGRAHAAGRGRQAQAGEAPPAGWPFPGMADAPTGGFDGSAGGPRPEAVSSDWSSGRSTSGSGYDARTMRVGSAGPPPGNPSGSLVTFGRYQGWTLGEVARTDLEFLEWLDRMPIGRQFQPEIDALLRQHGRRVSSTAGDESRRGLFRRR
jgi:curved DNA-binding protein CbpA